MNKKLHSNKGRSKAKSKHMTKDQVDMMMMELGGFEPLSFENINLGQSFALANNLPQQQLLSSGLAGAPKFNKLGGSGIGAGAIGAASTLGNDLIDALAKPDTVDDEGIIKVRRGSAAAKGALSGAAAGAALGPIGAAAGAVVGGVASLIGANKKEKEANYQTRLLNEKKRFNNAVNFRLANMTENQSYMPVARQGGFTVYNGQTHEGPDGGILTDAQGNPSAVSNGKPIALTENKEVARFNPDDNSTYIYSDSLGFAKPATALVNKYKLNKDNSQYKYDPLLKAAVDKQFDNLTQAQELLKEKKASKNKVGIYQEGGNTTKANYTSMGIEFLRRPKEERDSIRKEFMLRTLPLEPDTPKYQGGTVNTPMMRFNLFKGMTKVSPTVGNILNMISNGDDLKTIYDVTRDNLKFDTGGSLPKYEGDPNKPSTLPNNDEWMAAHGYVKGPYGDWRLSPSQLYDRFNGNDTLPAPPITINGRRLFRDQRDSQTGQLKRSGYGAGEMIADPIFSLFGKDYPHNRTAEDFQMPESGSSIRNTHFNVMGTAIMPFYAKSQGATVTTKPTLDIPAGTVLRKPAEVATGKGTEPWVRYAAPAHGEYNQLKPVLSKPIVDKLSGTPRRADRADAQILLNKLKGEDLYNPNLSPLGHILSGVGQIADYRAMKKFQPEEVSLQRAGAERISLAVNRLANERNAAAARAINTTNARSSGLNAGAAIANTAVANTGVNRLLGEQNAQSLMNEENTNAQFRQQANMLNAELAAQESYMNSQTRNAYRARLAAMNPVGNLARTAAGYFADNAAYGQGYDTLRMLAPNAEIYAPENDSFTNRLLGIARPKVRLK